LKTDLGEFVLKRVKPGDKERVRFLYEVANHVNKKEKKELMPIPFRTTSKKFHFDGFRYAYMVLPWLEGRPISFRRQDDWREASRELARFHQSTHDFSPKENYTDFSRLSQWESYWKTVHQQMEIFHVAAKWTSYPTDLDRAWLDISRYTMGMMENLLAYYQKLDGDKVCRESTAYGKVCHARLHRHNMLKNRSGEVIFVDWNEMVQDVRTADLADWILYAYGRTGSSGVIQAVLEGYQEVTPLEESEYALLYARLLFPEKLTRLLNNIYLNQTEIHATAISRVQAAIEIEEKKESLLKMYAELVKERFRVSVPQLDWLENG
jgi:CotS family spore coat protein